MTHSDSLPSNARATHLKDASSTTTRHEGDLRVEVHVHSMRKSTSKLFRHTSDHPAAAQVLVGPPGARGQSAARRSRKQPEIQPHRDVPTTAAPSRTLATRTAGPVIKSGGEGIMIARDEAVVDGQDEAVVDGQG